jgi:DNA-directed RNA polymerase subunit RPC12/RpoP
MNGDSARKLGLGLAILFSLTCATNATLGQEAKLDFRGKKDHEDFIRPAGKNGEKYLSYDDEGMRIHFKSGEGPSEPVGISWRFPVRGDFATSVHYEILEITPPTRGGGVGLELYLMLDNNARDGIPFARLVTGKVSRVLSVQLRTNDDAGNRITKGYKAIAPPENPRGRLKLAREKSTLIASYAEGDDENYVELNRIEIGEFDLRMVRIAIVVGNDPKAQADIRILECSLKGDVPGMPAGAAAPVVPKNGAVPPPQPAPAANGGNALFWILLFAGATTFVVLGIVFLVVWRHKTPAAPTNAPQDSNNEDDIETVETQYSPAMLAFPCETCGKKLKAKDTAGGKRVKCPGCGTAVLVPKA